MKKIAILTILFSFLLSPVVFAQESDAELFQEIQRRIQELRGQNQSQMMQVGQRVREMRRETREESQNFGEQVREMVHERVQQLKQERQLEMEQAKNRFQERSQEFSQEARRFVGLPRGLNNMNEQVTARYEAFLKDIEEIIAELDSEELTTEQEENLSSIKEEAASLWEEVPEKAAKSYYEEFENEDDTSFVGDMIRAFREDHVEFMQSVLSLREEAKTLYEEVIGEDFEGEEN